MFVSVSKEDYEKFIQDAIKKENERKINELNKFAIFASTMRTFKIDLINYIIFVDAKANHIVFKENDPVDFVYFITGGEYEMTKTVYEDKPNSLY